MRDRLALLAAIAALVAGCGSDEKQTTTSDTGVEAAPSAAPPPAETTVDLDLIPRGAYPVISVRAGQAVEMRTKPGGGELVKRIGPRTRYGSPSVFGVVDQRDGWAGVTTPLLPNGSLGWIKLDPGRVEGGWTRYSIAVDLSHRSATLLRGGRTKLSFPVTVGAPGAETPTGRFAVTDTFTGLDSAAYGCCALALSATQPHVPSGWLGGRTIAIHGTTGPLGVAASHGCIRAANENAAALVRTVPLGTPVFIDA